MVDLVVLTTEGKAFLANKIGGLDTTNFVGYIGYTNETTDPLVTDTSSTWFHAGAESGSRIIMQLASYTAPVLSLTFFFGAGQGNENGGSIAKVGFFTASTGGTLFLECEFGTPISKNSGKELQITLNATVAAFP